METVEPENDAMQIRARTTPSDRTKTTPRERRSAAGGGVIVSLAIMAAGACGADAVQEVGESGGDPGTHVAAALGTLYETSTGGTQVRLAFDPDPLAAGPLTLTLAMDPPPADPGAVSLDLVSPEMPMHGVMRYPVQEEGPGRFTAAVVSPWQGSGRST